MEVAVFAREEDPFLPDYHHQIESDPLVEAITIHLVNHARSNARFRDRKLETVFQKVLKAFQPDFIHFGHLSHLSTGLIEVASDWGVPIVFTLHDYWLMCPRGQFLQWGLTEDEPWRLCDSQENTKCAKKCFNRFVTGLQDDHGLAYWTRWVKDRMSHIRAMCRLVDLFLAPSRYLMNRHIKEFGLDAKKVIYQDYGFDLTRLNGRQRKPEKEFVFGYIGRHHPSKGIHHLIEAFCQTIGSARLRIWGRSQGQLTASLQRSAASFGPRGELIEWLPEYANEAIIPEVFNHCDCIVVPSIWDENSPLVIHEAQQAGVPVITSDHGGMGEYVKNGVNGLTFRHRNVADLQRVLQEAIDDPEHMLRLGGKGYLYSDNGQIPSVEAHTKEILKHYQRLLRKVRP